MSAESNGAFLPALPGNGTRIELGTLHDTVDRRLTSLIMTGRTATTLDEALRYSLLSPGKRLRPLLTILAAWEFGPRDLRALDAGCALEMVHAASLVLDDLPAMDNAVLRARSTRRSCQVWRGRRAAHGRGAAVARLCRARGSAGNTGAYAVRTRCDPVASGRLGRG